MPAAPGPDRLTPGPPTSGVERAAGDTRRAAGDTRRPAGPPAGDVEVPEVVRRLAGPDRWRPVWRNELGGLTFEVGADPGRRFVKWAPSGCGLDLRAEAARLEWAGAFHPVPRLLDLGSDPAGDWMVTAALPGRSAVDRPWSGLPAVTVPALGAGLRALHDDLPVGSCPFSWAAAGRVERVHRLAASGRLSPARWHPLHAGLSVEDALRRLDAAPAVDRLVVCHGDACSPNTLIAPDGRWCGHVDLGTLGLADRWADLAIATWSTGWNYGPGWEDTLLAAYGIDPDPDRTAYYRLLWDLCP